MPEKSLGRRDFVKLAAGGALAVPAIATSTSAQATGLSVDTIMRSKLPASCS